MIDLITPEFVAQLYSAVVETGAFQGLANLVSHTAGAATGAIWIVEETTLKDISITDIGAESMSAYMGHYHKLDVWQNNVARMPRDQVILGSDHTPRSELLKSEFYNDFARRYGMLEPLGAMVQLRPRTVATISLERLHARKLFDADDKPGFQHFIPYVKSALQLRLRHQDDARYGGLYAAALNSLTFGAVICDARSNVVFANPAAEAFATGGAGIVLGRRSNGLSALIPAESRALTALVNATAKGGPGGVMRLTGRDGGILLVLVTPLPRELRGDVAPGHALVSLRSARDRPAFAEAALTALFRLSPTQAAIARALHGGKTAEEIAAERGIRISTLRSHLAEIFARTGAEDQRDLIRLLGSLPPLR